ncbi:oxygen-dependent choline dehydrogenase [Nephila pilipes]|uniref:Oxygen-dependent choline dehydrogenase n=1 Tax=Nephila pilipes TaxID=299642 RepID=A0A8X6T7V6_NEPPI|nr:oxygen-dependent choline dehydrogenase [Nephila pilipes]
MWRSTVHCTLRFDIQLSTEFSAPELGLQARYLPSLQQGKKGYYIGAGAAGSVVASRLSEKPCVSVLLLEAGKAGPSLTDIPGFTRGFWGSDLNWDYKTVPQKNTGNAYTKNEITYPQGKVMGGTTIFSFLLYTRGNKKDYEDWESQGAKGWSYKDVYPYFLKLENNKDPEFLHNGKIKTVINQ